ncbi:MAG: C-terminal helicase domain-containing protein, partial [Syntrophomonadaceae bacterium]|nr:C-terminal helicase domain-containing protein [Syntrophomonadaceae bacterium]
SDISGRFVVHCDWIDGRVPQSDRQHKIDMFFKNNSPAVLILNPRAAGTGLNITAANHVIHYNLEWNPALEDQASARAYRRGQTKPVTIHRLFYINTVEEVINMRIEQKRALADIAVSGTDGETDNYRDILAALQISPIEGGN